MEKEIRYYSQEVSANEQSRLVSGYASVFNSPSQDLGGFIEYIDKRAFDDVINASDVFALFNHNTDKVLARSKNGVGSLKLSVDDIGLKYEFEAPNTALGDELLEFLKRGDITQSSFAFSVDSDTWEKQDTGMYIRTITKIGKLYDVSPVFQPAYTDTSVSCSRFAEIKEQERIENEKAMREIEEAKKNELKSYYSNLRTQNAKYL